MNLININTVIYRLEGVVVMPLPIADCYEWIGAALQHIGGQFPQKLCTAEIDISNYRGSVPCNFLQFVRWVEAQDDKDPTNTSVPLIEENRLPNYLETSYLYANRRVNFYDPTKQANPFNNAIKHSFNQWLDPNNKNTWNSTLDYRIENTSILTNLENGKLIMQYWGVPLDEKELPLIPDNESYIDACFWYCCKQLCYQGFKFKNPEFNLKFLENRWNRYCGQARAESNMPDLHGIQRMTNEFLRMLPITGHYYTSFKYLGIQQQNSRHGKFK
jgi:hypothetical protein